MAGAAAAAKGKANYQGDSRPTLEEQLAEVKKKENQQQATQARMNSAPVLSNSEQKARRSREEVDRVQRQQEDTKVRNRNMALAMAGPGGMAAGSFNQGFYDFRKGLGNFFRTALNLPKPALALGAVGVGAAAGYAVRSGQKVFNGTATAAQNIKVTGTFPIFLIALIVHIYDIRYGFPRGGVGQFGVIIGGYAAVTVLMTVWKGIPLKEVAPYIIAQIVVPWGLQSAMLNPTFSFINVWKETAVWVMILFTPILWMIFSHTGEDSIMKMMNFGYVCALCILLVPMGIYFINDSFGNHQATQIAAESTAKDILSNFWNNAKTFGIGAVNFIPNLISGSTKEFQDTPPPGAGVGAVQQIGLKPTQDNAIIRAGQSSKTNMLLFVQSADKTTYQFDTYCRVATDKDNTLEYDSDSDGFVDISRWTKIGTTPRLTSSRTIYCSVDPRSADMHGTRDSVQMQFGAMYDVKVVGSYTTYFIEEHVDPATGILISNYEGPTDFFKRNFGLDQVPISKATDSPCFMSIDNNQITPPIGIRPDEPSYTVPLVVGFQSKGAFGDTTIDSIKDLKIDAPNGVTDLVCQDDPAMFEKSALPDGRNEFTLKGGYTLHGKTIRLDCVATVDKSQLIWSGDYAQSTFLVTSTCSMFNKAQMNARLVGGSSGSGGYSRAWSAWPIEGPIVSCYGTETNPCIGNACNGQDPYSGAATRWHEGVDIAGGSNEVKAVESGTVDRVCNGENSEGQSSSGCSDNAGYGRVVIIKHSDNFYTFYGHLDSVSPYIAPGYQIEAGKVIGIAGSTGISTGVHLHFGISTDGKLDHAENDAETEIRNPLCDLPNPSSGGNTWSCPNSPKKCAPRAVTVSPAGYPSADHINLFEGGHAVSGYSGTLKSLAQEMGDKYGLDPAFLAATMEKESAMGTVGCFSGKSSLTGCGWPNPDSPGSCTPGCGCSSSLVQSDYTQVECTAKAYTQPETIAPGAYDHCNALSGVDKIKCIACTYQGAGGLECDYSRSILQYWASWSAYYRGVAK